MNICLLVEEAPETIYTPPAMQVFILWISQFLKEEIA